MGSRARQPPGPGLCTTGRPLTYVWTAGREGRAPRHGCPQVWRGSRLRVLALATVLVVEHNRRHRRAGRPTSVVSTRAPRHAAPAPGRHRQPPSLPLGTRRAIAATLVLLATGSAAIGVARAADAPAQVNGSLAAVSGARSGAPPAGTPSESHGGAAAPSAATPTAELSASRSKAKATSSARPTSPTALPTAPQPAVPDRGSGRLTPVLVPGDDTRGRGRVVTYAFQVEEGLGIDKKAAARTVGQTLRDPKGWQKQDGVRFVQVTPEELKKGTKPTLTIALVSPDKTDQMCKPLSTDGTWSCANHDTAVLNYRRWATATPTYAGRGEDYRTYQINHEVGHELGHPHVGCGGKGQLAPVMLQQSKGLQGCRPNIHPTVTRG